MLSFNKNIFYQGDMEDGDDDGMDDGDDCFAADGSKESTGKILSWTEISRSNWGFGGKKFFLSGTFAVVFFDGIFWKKS